MSATSSIPVSALPKTFFSVLSFSPRCFGKHVYLNKDLKCVGIFWGKPFSSEVITRRPFLSLEALWMLYEFFCCCCCLYAYFAHEWSGSYSLCVLGQETVSHSIIVGMLVWMVISWWAGAPCIAASITTPWMYVWMDEWWLVLQGVCINAVHLPFTLNWYRWAVDCSRYIKIRTYLMPS